MQFGGVDSITPGANGHFLEMLAGLNSELDSVIGYGENIRIYDVAIHINWSSQAPAMIQPVVVASNSTPVDVTNQTYTDLRQLVNAALGSDTFGYDTLGQGRVSMMNVDAATSNDSNRTIVRHLNGRQRRVLEHQLNSDAPGGTTPAYTFLCLTGYSPVAVDEIDISYFVEVKYECIPQRVRTY